MINEIVLNRCKSLGTFISGKKCFLLNSTNMKYFQLQFLLKCSIGTCIFFMQDSFLSFMNEYNFIHINMV